MRFDERDLLQGLLVLAASEVGRDVVVSVYGGRENVCGTVRFTFAQAVERARALRILRRWSERDVVVSLLSSGDRMSLFCERTWLDHALERAT